MCEESPFELSWALIGLIGDIERRQDPDWINTAMNAGRQERGQEPLIKCADGVWRPESKWRARRIDGLEPFV